VIEQIPALEELHERCLSDIFCLVLVSGKEEKRTKESRPFGGEERLERRLLSVRGVLEQSHPTRLHLHRFMYARDSPDV
jgi:hypothetical protein